MSCLLLREGETVESHSVPFVTMVDPPKQGICPARWLWTAKKARWSSKMDIVVHPILNSLDWRMYSAPAPKDSLLKDFLTIPNIKQLHVVVSYSDLPDLHFVIKNETGLTVQDYRVGLNNWLVSITVIIVLDFTDSIYLVWNRRSLLESVTSKVDTCTVGECRPFIVYILLARILSSYRHAGLYISAFYEGMYYSEVCLET